MRKNSVFRTWVVAALTFGICATQPLLAVRPVIIMFYGEPFKQPVFLTDTMVFHDLENPTTITARDLAGRRYFTVAMFWGSQWNPYWSGEKPIRSLTPQMASQHGWFYPATSTQPAVLLQTKPGVAPVPVPADASSFTWGGILDASWLDSLEYRGVPARQR